MSSALAFLELPEATLRGGFKSEVQQRFDVIVTDS